MEAPKWMKDMGWWHTIEFPDGRIVQGQVDYRGKEGDRFLLPKDLSGKSVIDFGTWNGFWAIEALKRGAKEVIAADRFDPPLELAIQSLSAYKIQYEYCDNLDYPLKKWKDQFDVVLFYGILYHLKNPHMGLWNAMQCCKNGGTVIIETAINQGKMLNAPQDIPLLWVIDTLHADDPTNYHMPNTLGAIQLCKIAGLNVIDQFEYYDRLTILCEKVS